MKTIQEELIDEMWEEQIKSREEMPTPREFVSQVIEELFARECEISRSRKG